MGSQQAVAGGSVVVVEVLAFRVTADGGLAFRVLAGELDGERHPDAVARDLMGLPRDTAAHLLHSTSWRHEPAGRVVLTYACCPDPRPDLPAVPLTGRTLARGDAPASPSPARPRPGQVAAHAVRHLEFLRQTDPIARQVIESVPSLPDLLASWSPAPAGQLPDGDQLPESGRRPEGRRDVRVAFASR